MCNHLFFAWVGLAASMATSQQPNEPKLPARVSTPIVVMAKAEAKGKDLVVLHLRMVETAATAEKKPLGWRNAIVPIDGLAVYVHDLAGKRVDTTTLPQSLFTERPALLSFDGTVDPYYLQTAKDGTIVIVMPEDRFAAGTANDWMSKDERAVLEFTNAERKAGGLAPLRANRQLTEAARSHSKTMAKLNQMGHSVDGTTPLDRVRAAGYRFRRMAENVAMGQETPKEVVTSWMESPGHRANIMGSEYEEIGVSVAQSGTGERYWTQVFGTGLK